LVTQEDAAQQAATFWGEDQQLTATIAGVYRRAGVEKRHSVVLTSSTNGMPAQQSFYHRAADESDRGPSTADRMERYEAEALALAQAAAGAALNHAGWPPERIAHLVTVSCTGFVAPGVDIGLVQGLGLRRDVTRTNIGFMGCHGALNGLRVARALAAADADAGVLLCCAELCSLHHQYTRDVQQIVANALFSDGAAAVVGTAADANSQVAWRIVDQRSCVLRDTTDLMSWRIRDHGFEMTLSRRVPEVIGQTLRPWISGWLAEHTLDIRDVHGWAIHPGGPRILSACEAALGLDQSALAASHEILADYGNMSSPTVLFILEELRRRHDALPCVVLAFGPGLTIEAALIR
jgi:predicted naringenin-chalcone synthase